MNVYIGADHRGYTLKAKLMAWLGPMGHAVTDCGNYATDQDDDYPDFAFAVAGNVAVDGESRGILICGSGVGMTICANKISGVRAVTGTGAEQVRLGRQEDNTNVLTLAADWTSEEKAKELVNVFLNTDFVPMERYVRRIKKIEEKEAGSKR